MKSFRRGLVMGAALWTFGLHAFWAVTLTLGMFGTVRIVHAHSRILLVLSAISMIGGVLVVRRALAPFDAMRTRLSDVRRGSVRQLDGTYPTEVQPLVDDLNALLAHNEMVVRRAIGKAGDLAHGLKTPLAVLSNEADRLDGTAHGELASTIAAQVALMQRQVEYHLAHARAAASGVAPGSRAPVAVAVDGLVRTLRRLYAERGITIDACVPSTLGFRGQPEDLEEMLGNLLDNACKWAKARVTISAREAHDSRIVVDVDDDGPGIDPSMRDAVLQRGVRADEAAPGSGLGLAIVRDLADLYGGSIALERADAGGVRAALRLPKS